ncbi:hypothetical protein QL285_038933 [Trifolium repens]|nr:hypothetical protein QL285_038933 [Trifolium repens]
MKEKENNDTFAIISFDVKKLGQSFGINLVTEKDQKTLRYLPHLASLFVSQHSSIFFTHCVFFSYALFSKSNVTTHPSGVSEDIVYNENLYQYGEKLNRAKNKSQGFESPLIASTFRHPLPPSSATTSTHCCDLVP